MHLPLHLDYFAKWIFLLLGVVGLIGLSTPALAFQAEDPLNVTGTVTSEDGEPLIGVNILVQGTTTGTVSDINGEYSLEVPREDAVLVFSYTGYEVQEVPVNGRSTIDLSLSENVVGLDEVVVVGYGTQKKANLTGAVATVNAESLERINSVNATNIIEGQLPGVMTKQTSGQPGSDNTSISIRGFGDPLIMIDGVERDMSSIDPSMIESVTVLKDASAAIYGARAGNGVVLITTKRGTEDQRPQIRYEGSFSGQQFTHHPKMITDAGRYTDFWVEAEENVGLNPTYTQEEIDNYYAGVEGYESYDWYDWAIRDWAPRQRHNLSVRGGSEAINYYVGLGVSNQEGVISSDDWWYRRYNVISNIDGKITDNLSFLLDVSFAQEQQSETSSTIWRGIYKSQPMAPTSFEGSDKIPASNLTGTHQRLVGAIDKDIQGGIERSPRRFTGRAELAYDFPFAPGLTLRGRFDYRLIDRRTVEVERQWEVYTQDPNTGELILDGRFPATVVNNGLWVTDYEETRLKPRVSLEYNRDFGEHSVQGLLLGEFIDDDINEINAETQNLLSNELMYLGFGDRAFHELGQDVQETSRASFAGRLNYAFRGKYLLEATFRYDASSFFPPDSRWGFFPSFSAGWRMSEEPFMANATWLDNLKLRASYSRTGYDLNAIRYDYFAGYNVFTNPQYLIGPDAYRRLQIGTLPNPNMTWEKMTNYNLGLDANLWNGQFNFVGEVFYRKRTDILATPQQTFPSTFGATLSRQNLNSREDRGFELELGHVNRIGNFRYNIRGIFSYARSDWIHFEEEDYTDPDEIRILQQSGRNVNRAIGYVTDGIFRSQSEIDNHPVDQDQAENTTLIPGDIKYVDLNGDGVITFADQQRIGYATGEPDLNYGLNFGFGWKGLNLNVLLQGGSMYSGYISGLARVPFQNASSPFEIHWQERFHPERNPDGTQPAVSMGVREHNAKYSDFWLRSITYLRLENINLSYALPQRWMESINMQGITVFVTGNNLAVISNLGEWASEFDPEAPLTNTGYPPQRTVTFGLNATF